MQGHSSKDSEHVGREARRLAAELAEAAEEDRPPRGPARVLRTLRLGIVRHARTLVRDHWDLGLFDVAFGSLKAFGIYRALLFAGLAWTIPLLEYAPLNTQLWTAGYLLARRKLLSAAGRIRYGRSGDELDALRARLLRGAPTPGHAVHRFSLDGAERMLRVRRSRLAAWWESARGRVPGPGVIGQRELRARLADELRFQCEPLRVNAYLYERVAIELLLQSRVGRARLAAMSLPAPDDDPELAALLADPEPTRARIAAEGDRLRESLRAAHLRAARGVARGLCWLHAVHRRAIRRRLAELRGLEYRLLAALAGGAHATDRERAALAETIGRRRRALRAHLARATRLAARAAWVRSGEAALRLLRVGLREARACGLAARRAGLALCWHTELKPALAMASPAADRVWQ